MRAPPPALQRVACFSERKGLALFVVGGWVRDRLLGLEPADLDLVWVGSGDPRATAEDLARELSATVSYRRRFLTASLVWEDSRIDLGRARAESYPKPAALPEVREGSLQEDLLRRDFTVNALAWPIEAAARPAPSRNSLIDLCGGAADLDASLLRTLHEGSFRDDPTRILRGVELANRRGFEFEAATREQARAALDAGAIERLSPDRLRHEVERLFARSAEWAGAAKGLRRLGVDRKIDPAFELDSPAVERLRRAAGRVSSPPAGRGEDGGGDSLAAIALVAWSRGVTDRRRLARRLGLGRAATSLLTTGRDRVEEALRHLTAVDFSLMDATRSCARLSPDERRLLFLAMDAQALERWNEVRPRLGIELTISGDDLVRRGAVPGPRIGTALERTLAARWSGELQAAEELEHALEWLEKEGGGEDA